MKTADTLYLDKSAVPARILELRMKIQDETYITSAVHRIALVLSRQLVEDKNYLDQKTKQIKP